jgi:hypothetical protein
MVCERHVNLLEMVMHMDSWEGHHVFDVVE